MEPTNHKVRDTTPMMTHTFAPPEEHVKIEKIVQTYGKLMFHVANAVLHNEHDAEDAVQQALIAIYQNISKISDIECPKSRSFIVTIVERKAIDLYRAKQRGASVSLEEEYIHVPAVTHDDTLSDRSELARAMAALPARYREVLFLKYDHGYSDREIAAMLDMTAANVRKTVQRAKKKLETMLTERGLTT